MGGTVTISELKVLLSGDNSSLKESVEDSESVLSRFGGVASGAFKVAGAAALAFTGAAAGVIGTGVAIASDLEQAETRFESLLGSGEEAKAFLEDLKAFSLTTPFDLPTLTQASQRLSALGADTESVIPILQAAGDAAQALGTGSAGVSAISEALAKVQQTGEVTTRTLTGLVNQGVPAFDFLAAKLGVDVPTAMQMVEDGVVDSGTFIASFLEGVGTNFGGAMEKQSQTFAGMISNVKDELALQLADVAAPLLDSFTPLVPQIGGVLSELLATVGPIMADVVGNVVTIFGQLLPALTPFVTLIGTAMQRLAPAVMPLVDAFVALIPPILTLAEALMPVFVSLVEALAGVLTAVLVAAEPLITALVGALVPVLEALTPLFPPLVNIIMALIPILAAVANLVAALAPLLQLVGVVLLPLVPILQVLTPLIELLGKVLVPIINFITLIIEALVNLALALTGNQEAWQRFGEALTQIGTTIINGVKEMWNALVEWFKELGMRIIEGLVDGITSAWDSAKDVVGDVGNNIKDGFTDLFGIGSPSKVFFGYGEDIVDGLAMGLRGLDAVLPMPDRLPMPSFDGGGAGPVTIQVGTINVPVSQGGDGFDPANVGQQIVSELSRITREAFAE